MKSHRSDGLGHWPRGKRRHADAGQWTQTRRDLVRLIDDHWAYGVISYSAAARDLGVSKRSVRRWAAAEDMPSPEHQSAVAAWVEARRGELERRRGKRATQR